jgi:O-antigen/teichoic acid export membrane protein
MRNSMSSRLLQVAGVILPVLFLLLGTPEKASAYMDPGTGALIVQAIMGAFVGLMFYLKKFTSIFKPKAKKEPEN